MMEIMGMVMEMAVMEEMTTEEIMEIMEGTMEEMMEEMIIVKMVMLMLITPLQRNYSMLSISFILFYFFLKKTRKNSLSLFFLKKYHHLSDLNDPLKE